MMNINDLRKRIREETDLDKFIGEENVDYEINKVLKKPIKISAGNPQSLNEIFKKMAKSRNEKNDLGAFRIQYIVDNDNKAEWRSEQVSNEICRLPYVVKEKNMKKVIENDDEIIYIGTYLVDTNWIRE